MCILEPMNNAPKLYDVVIIGGGPAGGQCARELSSGGKKVFLAERVKDFSLNDFSSGGSPQETIRDFSLPTKVVGAHWDSLIFAVDNLLFTWKGTKPRGVVFDFAALRRFLTKDAKAHGAHIYMGCQFISRTFSSDGSIDVTLQENGHEFH